MSFVSLMFYLSMRIQALRKTIQHCLIINIIHYIYKYNLLHLYDTFDIFSTYLVLKLKQLCIFGFLLFRIENYRSAGRY